MAKRGLSHLTIEGVAARAGVAKTTIYRWWPSRGALAVEAFFAAMTPQSPLPNSGSAVADLRAHMQSLARALGSTLGHIVADLVAEGRDSEETRKAFLDGYLLPRRESIKQALKRGIASGELRPDIDFDVTIDALYGSLICNTLLRFRQQDDAWVNNILDTVLRGMAARTA